MTTPNEASKLLAAGVSQKLREHGIAQRDIAGRTGIPLTTLTRRLTGNSPFNLDELALIAAELGMSLAELINFAETAAA